MRDRLIELLHDSDLSLDSVTLADYLLENGVVVLPCKVNDCAGCSFYDTDITDQPCCTCTCGSNFASGDNL